MRSSCTPGPVCNYFMPRVFEILRGPGWSMPWYQRFVGCNKAGPPGTECTYSPGIYRQTTTTAWMLQDSWKLPHKRLFAFEELEHGYTMKFYFSSDELVIHRGRLFVQLCQDFIHELSYIFTRIRYSTNISRFFYIIFRVANVKTIYDISLHRN